LNLNVIAPSLATVAVSMSASQSFSSNSAITRGRLPMSLMKPSMIFSSYNHYTMFGEKLSYLV